MFEDVPATASEWAIRLNSGAMAARDRRAFMRWLADDRGRLSEIDEAQALLRVSGALRKSPDARLHLAESLRAVDAMTAAAPRRTHLAIVGGALAACVVIAGVFLSGRGSHTPVLDDDAKVATAVGNIKHFELSDRSSLTIGASSAVQMAFTDTQREMSLDSGKAFFEVTHDTDRPFIIKAGSHQITVTGTKFNVSYNRTKDALEVAVVEGTVNVAAPQGNTNAASEKIAAGGVFLFPANRPASRGKLTPDQAAAWREGMLYFDDAELEDVVLEANGYLPKPLVLTGTDISHLTLTAQLPAGDTQAMFFILREVLGVEAQEASDRWELFKSRTGQ